MIKVPILDAELHHLVLDFNGTLACDGVLRPGVDQRLRQLATLLRIHVITGNTFGSASSQLQGLPCDVQVLPADRQSEAKEAFVQGLGRHATACVGNGRNDCLMMRQAALGIAVIQQEGAWSPTVQAAHIVTTDITDALDLLLVPKRLLATLRN